MQLDELREVSRRERYGHLFAHKLQGGWLMRLRWSPKCLSVYRPPEGHAIHAIHAIHAMIFYLPYARQEKSIGLSPATRMIC